MTKHLPATLIAGVLISTTSVGLAQSSATKPATNSAAAESNDAETLRKQLAAQRAINEQLKQRVDALERQLAAGGRTDSPVVVGLDASAPKPRRDLETDLAGSAIEETLGAKGLVLLAPGTYRFTPSLSWSHSGRGDDRSDSYVLGTGLEAGLPMGMAISLRQPYVWRDTANGSNSGAADFSISLAKKLNNETATMPSFVARLTYAHDNGKDAFDTVPIGSGFKAYSVELSGVKRADPLVFFGGASYSHAFDKTATISRDGNVVFSGNIAPGDAYGLNAGVSLAATPTVSVDLGLSLGFIEKTRFSNNQGSATGDSRTVGYLSLGTGILLSRNLLLSLSAAAGVTDDSADLILSVSLPYRF
jgi:hypothetical protein